MDVGEVIVHLTGDTSGITSAFNEMEAKLAKLAASTHESAVKMGSSFETVGGTLVKVGGIMSGVSASVLGVGIAAAKGFGEYAEGVQRLSAQTGMSEDSVQKFQFALNRVGLKLEDLVPGFKKLSQQAVEAMEDEGKAGDKARENFAKFGITVDDLRNTKPEDIFIKMMDGAAKMDSAFVRTQALSVEFGRGAQRLALIAKEGGQAFAEQAERAKDLGAVFSGPTLKAATAMDDEFDDLNATLGAFTHTMGETFVNVLAEIIPPITKAVGAFNVWWQALDEGTKKTVLIFGAAFAVGGPILVVVGLAMTAIAALSAPLMIGGAVVLGIAAGIAAIVANWEKLKASAAAIWQGIKDAITSAITGIAAGVKQHLVDGLMALLGPIGGFTKGVTALFAAMHKAVTGGSEVPDMVREIGQHMSMLDVKMEAPARSATIGTLQAFKNLHFGIAQLQAEMVNTTISTWGNMTNAISSALAKQVVQGNDWKKTFQSLQEQVLQSYINMGLQMLTQGSIVLAKKLIFGHQEEVAAASVDATKTTISAAGDATRLTATVATGKLAGAAAIAEMGAIALAVPGIMSAVVIDIAAVFAAMGAALAASIVGAPFAPAFEEAAGAVIVGGMAANATATSAIMAAMSMATSALAVPAAAGGIVSSPTLILAGEAGREAIVPLDKAGGFGGGPMTIQIAIDGKDISRAALKYMPGLVRLQGVITR